MRGKECPWLAGDEADQRERKHGYGQKIEDRHGLATDAIRDPAPSGCGDDVDDLSEHAGCESVGGIHSSLRNSEDDGIACPDVIGQADTGLIEENAHGAFENPGAAPCTGALGIGDMRLVYVALHHATAQDEHRQG
ncbi:hypothetical protein D3C75_977640 [compost metagenome]